MESIIMQSSSFRNPWMLLSPCSQSLALRSSGSRRYYNKQQPMIVVGSTSPSPADAAASRRSIRRSKGGNGGGATRDEIELQKQSSDIQIQVSLQDSKQTDARVALLYKSAAAPAGANTSVNTIRPDPAAWKTRESWLIDEARQIIRVDEDQGPPRWYCPVEAAGFPENAPLLLCLPDIVCNGLSITLHQQKLARLFKVQCLHVPFCNQAPYEDLLEQVEAVIKEEQIVRPKSTIYLMGEAYGGVLALLLAARNPHVNLVLVLIDPATWCDDYQVLSPFQSLLEAAAPVPFSLLAPFLFSLTFGDPVTVAKAVNMDPSSPQLEQTMHLAVILQELLQILATAMLVWSKAQCQWKVQQLQLAAHSANRQLEKIRADILLLASGEEQNLQEAKKLKQLLPSCSVRVFKDSKPALLMDERVQVASLIKATHMYRIKKHHDIVLDYLPPTEDEIKTFHNSHIRIMKELFSPVFLTVDEKGKMKRGVPRITKEHPILFICNHTFVGFDLGILLNEFLEDQNVMIRSLAHPALIMTDSVGDLPESGLPDLVRLLGGVTVTGNNLYKLMAAHEAVLLLPGGIREAVKRKGEAYKLLWPKKPEFVRTAVRHGATIIPVAAVGGDDFIQILLDQDQVLQLPIIGEAIRNIGANIPRARLANRTEVAEDSLLGSIGFPKPPPRMYFAFQKPIYTHEFPQILHNKEAVDNLYQQVKAEIESGLHYLLQKRKEDPYESFIPRIIFENTWGHSAPTFEP